MVSLLPIIVPVLWILLICAVYFTVYLWLNFGYKLLNKTWSCRTLLDAEDEDEENEEIYDGIGDVV